MTYLEQVKIYKLYIHLLPYILDSDEAIKKCKKFRRNPRQFLLHMVYLHADNFTDREALLELKDALGLTDAS